MGKKGSCQGVLASEKLVKALGEEQYEQVQKLLKQERFSHGDNFEKLRTGKQHLVFSIRLNQEKRVLLTRHELDGQPYWVLLDYLEHHEYHRSPFLEKGHLKKHLSQDSTIAELRDSISKQGFAVSSGLGLGGSGSSSPAEEPSASGAGAESGLGLSLGLGGTSSEAAEEISHIELRVFNRELIVLNPEQEKALTLSEPMLVTGMPGSGKSCVALTYLTECLQRTKDDELPLLYVTESELLAKNMGDTFRASPLGKATPAGRVLFLSYGELVLRERPDLEKAQRVGKKEFAEWFDKSRDNTIAALKKEFGPKAAELLYQEMRMASALDMKRYESLGERDSPLFNTDFVATERYESKRKGAGAGAGAGAKAGTSQKEAQSKAGAARRAAVFALKTQYEAYLKQKNQYDVSFLKLDLKAKYSHIAADEAQDFSTLQLALILQLAMVYKGQPAVACFSDSNQSVEDNFPKLNFFKTFLGITQIGELPGSFRCSEAVRQLANGILGIKYHLTGGVMEKGGQAFIARTEGASEGSVRLVPERQDLQEEALQKRLAELTATPRCVVITPEDQKALAKTRFPGALVLTPKQAKGLEYEFVILFRMLDRPFYHDMDEHLADYKPVSAGSTVHRAKRPRYECHAPLNELFTAATRARAEVYILQDTHSKKALHPITHLVRSLKDSLPKATAATQEAPVKKATKEDWLAEMKRQVQQDHLDVAWEIADKHLSMEYDQFQQQILKLGESKKESKEEKKEEKYLHKEHKEHKGVEKKASDEPKKETPQFNKRKKTKPAASGGAKTALATPAEKPSAVSNNASPFKSKTQMLATMILVAPVGQVLFNTLHDFLNQDDCATYLFNTDMGEGVSLLEEMATPKIEVMVRLLQRNPEQLKKITLDLLCTSRKWTRLYHSMPLQTLVHTTFGVELLSTLLEANPEWIKSPIFHQALYEPLPQKAIEYENATALYFLCHRADGQILFKSIAFHAFSLAPETFVRALCYRIAAKEYENQTPLFFLCQTSDGLGLLRVLSMLKDKQKFFLTEVFIETICLPLNINISVLYALCHTSDLSFLSTLIDANPNLFANERFVTALCRPVTTSRGEGTYKVFKDTSALYHLSDKSAGLKLLDKLIDANPDAFATEAVATALTCPITEADNEMKSTSALTLLRKSPEGEALLAKLRKINPDLRSKLGLVDQDNRQQRDKQMQFFQSELDTSVLTLLKKAEELEKHSKINKELRSKLHLEYQDNRDQGDKQMRFFQQETVAASQSDKASAETPSAAP